jgi:predicted MFS family arabinose efflux permease
VSTYGLQALVPDRLRGRMLSLDYGLATLAIGLSAVVAGLLADWYGVRAATWILTGLAAIYGVAWLAWTRPLWRRCPPETPAEPAVVPTTVA